MKTALLILFPLVALGCVASAGGTSTSESAPLSADPAVPGEPGHVGTVDLLKLDGGAPDSGSFEGGPVDGGSFDGSPGDGGTFEGGPYDGGSFEGGPYDGGSFEGGPYDGGSFEGGPGDGGDAGACISFVSAREPACESDLTLYSRARQACAAQGAFLNDFTPNERCGAGSSTRYRWACCDTPPSCTMGGGMGGPTCETDRSLIGEAVSSCGGSIAEFKASRGTCAAGQATSASFVCGCL